MVETPKYDLSNGKDANVIATLNKIAASGNRTNPLTLEDLTSLGEIKNDNSNRTLLQRINLKFALAALKFHLKGLFATRKLGLSTGLNFLSWALIGLAYPMFNAFLPTYLSVHAGVEETSLHETYRNNLIVNVVSIFGPVIAGLICDIPHFGRRGTMALGAVLTMAFMFAYTGVKDQHQNLGLACAINVCLNIYYGTLFAYTPEVLPSAHRATGNGISVSVARGLGTIAPVVAYYSGTATSVPIFVMAALFGVIAVVSLCFPYEVSGRNSM
jgi:hypothetical protein